MIKLLKKFKMHKPNRKKYRIKPHIGFAVDRDGYIFSLLPTVLVQPWMYRYPGHCIVDITWLHFHICIGVWENRKENKE